MVRKQRRAKAEPPVHGACVVCGMRDARALLSVELSGGGEAVLCGSHELMHRRAGGRASSAVELRAAFGERRETSRRAVGEVDELAANLAAAFTNERRVGDRRSA